MPFVCRVSASAVPIQSQHLVAKTELTADPNTHSDVSIQQPNGTTLYVIEILVTHTVENPHLAVIQQRHHPLLRSTVHLESMPAMRHGVIAKTSNLDPTPTCRTDMEREKNQLIDELSIRDQRLQQVDTIMAELQDKMYSVKTKHHPPERQQNEAQSAL